MSGWLQVLIGLVGLYFTITSSAPALDALSRLGAGQSLPPEFTGVQGFIRVFLLVLALGVLVALVLIGLAIILATVFRTLGAGRPIHAAFSLVAALSFFALTITVAIYGNPVWVFSALFMLSCLVLAGIAAATKAADGPEEIDAYWGSLFLFGAASIVVGGFAMIPMAAPASEPAVQATRPID